MKPFWIGPLTILSANYNRKDYSWDLSTDPSLNYSHNTFHVCTIKPYGNNNWILLPQHQLVKPGPILHDRYEVEKVIEYRKVLRTSVPQYKVCWLGYAL